MMWAPGDLWFPAIAVAAAPLVTVAVFVVASHKIHGTGSGPGLSSTQPATLRLASVPPVRDTGSTPEGGPACL